MPVHFILTAILGWMVNFHPFYISLTEARYNSDTQRFEIAQRIFWDDLEEALAGESGESINFLNPADNVTLEKMVEDYLLKNNSLEVNGNILRLSYLGFEVEEDAAWFYLESEKAKRPKEVRYKNTLLLKYFEGQQNIVHIYSGSKPKSLMLDKRKTEGVVKLVI
ncbi:hypothetical protein KI659_05775 [Litoribacter alkaliphilus]|uniref:Uncharacterized protein n=1 Tax=Litoribacter ruber TaxID=702568 RepID=A0AAP2CHU1_9BACT|nr:DUF6702 family protein [Litoribacter alkaliphilus]MBS9523526.1 hypothetical protein [Litoribacter alkaliphilus]